jgi:putrescine transport system permease protein
MSGAVPHKQRFQPALRRIGIILPPLLWLSIFFLLPFLVIARLSLVDLALALPPYTPLLDWSGDGLPKWLGDLQNFELLFNDALYLAAFLESLKIAAITTLICLTIGFPMAYAMARAEPRMRIMLVTAVILPFWTSFLIRVYAWTGLLRDNGIINSFLLDWGLIETPIRIINTDTAVFIGTVYTYLPFMVLPLFAALEKLDWSLLEASEDLGARPWWGFLTIIVPLAFPGIVAGALLVFIPVTGEFVIPALLGGPDTLMIGKVLWEEFFNNRDWPVASALAIMLVGILIIPLAFLQGIYAGKADEEGH